MKRLLIIVAALAAFLAGCASGGAAGGSSDGATVLQTSSHSAIKDPEQKDIHDQATLQTYWDKVYADQSSKPAVPNVDFTKLTVVYYAAGEFKHGGYSLKVSRAEPAGTGYAVGITVIQPGMNCHNMTQDVTHPFIFATVPTTGPVTFDEVKKRETPPCT